MNGLFPFLSKLKIPTSIIIGTVWIVSGIIIFLPEKFLNALGLYDFKISYNGIIGMVFLISFALIILFCTRHLYKMLKTKYRWHLRKKRLKEMLNNDSSIRKILEQAYHNNMNIIEESTDSNIIYLFNEGILYRPQQIITVGWQNEMPMKYVVHPWASKIIKSYFEGQVK